MSYAVIEDVAASWEQYEPIGRSLGPLPNGLLVHVAGPTEEGFRIIEIWESEGAWERFREDRLGPALAGVGSPVRGRLFVRSLHPTHVVVGGAIVATEADRAGG